MTRDTDLLPCPFCGAEPPNLHLSHITGRIFCEGCGAEGPWSPAFDGDWNTRAHPVHEPPSPGVTAGVTGDTPIGGRVRFAVPAGRTWNDMREWLHTDPKGQSLHQHGDCLLVWANEDDLFATPAPVVPAEGLDAEHLVAAWLDEMEVFATRRERLMDDVLAECDLAPWLHAACQVGIDAALRSAQPVVARVWQPIETAPKDGVTEVLMYDPDLGMAVWPSSSSPWPNVTHWMPLPEPPAALLPAGEGEE